MSTKVNLKAQVVISVFLVLLGSTASAGRIIKVPLDFDNIQAAIDDANDGDLIFVSDGIYAGDGNRDIDFAGKAITVRSEQGPTNCIIDCQGSADEQHMGFLFQSGEGPNSILDGFTITNGHHEDAGAILCTYVYISDFQPSSPTITNCVFIGNSAESGGAIYNYGCSPTLTNCRFVANSARLAGGGIYNYESSPTVTDCNFSDNSADWGGGIYNVWSSPTLAICTFSGNSAGCTGGGIQNECSDTTVTGCMFTGNSARYGGGMSQDSGDVMVTHCTFSNNIADHGGGMINLSSLTLTNCTFTGNSAIEGGGLFNNYGTPVINNCTFSGNSAELGGGIYCYYSESSTVTNCIFWGNTADSGSQIALDYSHNQSISYCDIQGGWSGDGNIDADPCFADQNNGHYHLKSRGGRWEPSSQNWIQDDVTSPCIDAGDIGSPIGYEPFPNGGIVNMGAYGGTAEASKSYFGKPVCKTIVAGDINGDCIVNFLDFRLMAAHWLENNSP